MLLNYTELYFVDSTASQGIMQTTTMSSTTVMPFTQVVNVTVYVCISVYIELFANEFIYFIQY